MKLFRDLPFNVRRPDARNVGLFISHNVNLTLINMFLLSCIWTLNPSTMLVMIQRSCFFVFVFYSETESVSGRVETVNFLFRTRRLY